MKKNLLRSLLAIVLLFALATPLMAYSGFQDFLRANGRLGYVDYTRIKQETRRSIRVSFEIGNQSFNGVLKKGYRLDDATADSLIRSVMVEMGLNNAALVVHETNIERAKKIDPAFKPQFWIEMIGQALGAGNAMAYADLLRGKISGTEYFMGQFEGKLLSYGTAVFAEATALSPAGMVVMNLITDCGETAVKEALKAVKNDEIKQQAITSAAILDSFYKRCNQKLKAEADSRQQQFLSIVNKSLNGQAGAFAKATGNDSLWRILSGGDFTVDPLTKSQAQQDIGEDGYWGVKQTSQRLFDFAYALAGDDVEKMKKMQAAMEKGFKMAAGKWGGELPGICGQTREAANKLFEDYYKSKEVETEETM